MIIEWSINDIMKLVIVILLTFILLVVDVSFLPFFRFDGVYSSALTIFIFVYCMNNEKYGITCLSLFSGFLQDVYFHNVIGVNMLLNLVLGNVVYLLSTKCNKNKHVFYIFIISILHVCRGMFINLYLVVMGYSISLLNIFYEFLHVFVLSLFMYPMLNGIFKSKLFKKALEF